MIFKDKKDRAIIRRLLADFANVEAACVPAPAARKESVVAGFFGRSNAYFADLLPFAYAFAARYWGDQIARNVCRVYGGGDSINTVKPDRMTECFAAFTRLGDPHLIEPRPAAKLAPYIAQTGIDARLAKVEFAIAVGQRAAKADQLYRKLWASVEPFESVSAYYDLEIPNVPPGMADLLGTGLTRMTVGNWDNPCPRGLTELQGFLALPVGSKLLHEIADNMRAGKAFQWEAFDQYVGKRLDASLDGAEHDRLRAAFNTARKHGRNLFPWDACEVFADKRNAPDMTLDAFERAGSTFKALRKDWYGYERKARVVEANSKLVVGLIDNGLTEFK